MKIIDLNGYRIGETKLQPQEREILWLLMQNPLRVVRHEEIWDHLWPGLGANVPHDRRGLVIVRMVYLRKKLEGSNGSIESFRGVGYQFRVVQEAVASNVLEI